MNVVSKLSYVIICHTGAGQYSTKGEIKYKTICKESCKAAEKILLDNHVNISDKCILNATVAAMKVLENNPLTNAGFGSNLTINGNLECEAGIMCGKSLRFGAVGCVSCIKNPIEAAAELLTQQIEQPLLSLGRYPPTILVGKGAEQFARSSGIEMVDSEKDLILTRKYKKYLKFKEILKSNELEEMDDEENEVCNAKRRKLNVTDEGDNVLNDTVGVIVCVIGVGIVSASSSGGIFLKFDGRLGQSCTYGAGCFAKQTTSMQLAAVSTGLGEQLLRTLLPMRVCEEFLGKEEEEEDIFDGFSGFIDDNFMNSSFLAGDELKTFGILGLRAENIEKLVDNRENRKVLVEVIYGHSTDGLCFGILSSNNNSSSMNNSQNVTTFVSRKESQSPFVVGSHGLMFHL